MDVGRDKPDDAWLQERYASWLDVCTRGAYAVSLLTFAIYASGALPPYVPFDRLPDLWHLPLAQYLEATGAATGWDWLRLLRYGDYLNYVGLALFALIVLLCHAALIVPLLKRGERLLAALAAAQVAVLAFAASGLLAGG
jgi:hypothetical protein